MPPRRRAAAAKTPIPDVVENNGLLTPGSTNTPTTKTRGRALKKNDSGLTPASTVVGSDMDENTEDLLAAVKTEMIVEIPVKRSSRAIATKPKYNVDDDEDDELEDKKPIVKDFASRKRKGTSVGPLPVG